jgi:DNA repair protein RecO (recombination protein O)
MLGELGYKPVLDRCAGCGDTVAGPKLSFSAANGGLVCPRCQPGHAGRRTFSHHTIDALRELEQTPDAWMKGISPETRKELRGLIGGYITYLMGKPPGLLSYLGN